MFRNFSIQEFTEAEADIYMKSLISVAFADGDVKEIEKDYINAQAELLSITTYKYIKKLEAGLSWLDSSKMSITHRMVLLRDCIILGSVDGNFDLLERHKILEIASVLGIDESDVKAIEEWLEGYLKDL